MNKLRIFGCLFIISLLATYAWASWLSDISGVDINANAGTVEVHTPHPEHIPDMLRNLPKDVSQAVLNPNGAMMATLIRQAAAQYGYGSQGIPQQIRSILAPYIPENIINKARYNVLDFNRITLPSELMGLVENIGAMTLDNVIVFRSADSAMNNWSLWGHELVHVMQYDNMGVEGFANMYTLDWNSLENQAYDWQHQIEARVQQNQQQNMTPQQNYWSVNRASSGYQLTDRQFVQAAQQVVAPQNCAKWWTVMGGAYIQNVCRVPIAITGWTQINPYNGYPFNVPCVANCGIPAGATLPFSSPAVGNWVNVFFNW